MAQKSPPRPAKTPYALFVIFCQLIMSAHLISHRTNSAVFQSALCEKPKNWAWRIQPRIGVGSMLCRVVLLAAPKCLEVVVLVHQLPVQPWQKLAMLLQRNMLRQVVVLLAVPSKCL